METFIQLGDGITAFVTGGKDISGCDHQWDGEERVTFSNSHDEMKGSEYRAMFHKMSEAEWRDWHKGKGSVTGEVTCSKCGMPYTYFDNPNYY